MRVLLDTKDLINVLEHDRPVKLSELRGYLVAQNSTIVLTFGNVRELAAPLAQGAPNVHVNFLLQRVETLPVSYLAEVMLPVNEVRAAVHAFNSGAEYEPIDPYVSRWDQTMSGTPSAAARSLILHLNEIVLLAAREDRSLFGGFGFYEESLRKLFETTDGFRPLPECLRKTFRTSSGARLLQMQSRNLFGVSKNLVSGSMPTLADVPHCA